MEINCSETTIGSLVVHRRSWTCRHYAFLKLFLCTFFALICTSTSQAGNLRLAVKTGPTLQFKKSVRNIYDQTLPLGSVRAPVSLFIELISPVNSRSSLFAELGRSHYVGGPKDQLSMSVHPLFVGLRRNLAPSANEESWHPYVAVGPSFYVAVVKATLNDDDFSGLPSRTVSQLYSGLGIHVSAGVDSQVGDSVILGLQLRADYNHLGDPATGGMGNIGGLTILVGLSKLL